MNFTLWAPVIFNFGRTSKVEEEPDLDRLRQQPLSSSQRLERVFLMLPQSTGPRLSPFAPHPPLEYAEAVDVAR